MAVESRTSRQVIAEDLGISGIKYIFGEGVSTFRRLLWALAALTLAVVMGWILYKRTSYYIGNPKTIDMQNVYMKSQTFPRVTLCNTNMMRATATWYYNKDEKDLFDGAKNIEETPYPMLTDLFDVWDKITLYNTLYDRNQEIQKLVDIYGELISMVQHGDNSFYRKFFLDLAPDVTDVAWVCKWGGDDCDWERDWTKVFTDAGVCYIFNQDGRRRVQTAGAQAGLKMILTIEEHEYMKRMNKQAGILLTIQDQNEDPTQVISSASLLDHGTNTHVALSVTNYTNLPSDACSETTTMSKCLASCLKKYIIDTCHCVDLRMEEDEDVPTCAPLQLLNCSFVEIEHFFLSEHYGNYCSGCKPKCSRLSYETRQSFTRLSDFDNLMHAKDLIRQSFGPELRRRYIGAMMLRDWTLLHNTKRTYGAQIRAISNMANDLEYDLGTYYSQIDNNRTFTTDNDSCLVYSNASQIWKNFTRLFDESWTFVKEDAIFQRQNFQMFDLKLAHDLVAFNKKFSAFFGELVRKLHGVVQLVQMLSSLTNCTHNATIYHVNFTYFIANANMMYSKAQDANYIIHTLETEVRNDEVVQKSFMPWDEEMSSDYYKKNLIYLNIFFRDMSVLNITQQSAITIEGLICDLGGNLGLYLGASLLTIVEIVDLCIRICLNRGKAILK